MAAALTGLGFALTFVSAAYAWVALLVRARVYRGAPSQPEQLQPVTVFKPLCGLEPRLEENLAGLCQQVYPKYQLLFGVRDLTDPAIDIVKRVKAIYPECDIELVADSRVHGANYKVSNLMNMAAYARYPWLLLADSDIAVTPDYLQKVAAPLADPAVGIVTCLYYARPLPSFWARMGALFIDTWFAPSVRVASQFGSSAFGFGATIALRAETLASIGGFAALRNRLADDYWLGKLTRAQGMKTVLCETWVSTDVVETHFAALWARERRWMATIRKLNPLGFTFAFITFTFPMLIVGMLLAPVWANLGMALLGAIARFALHWRAPAAGLPRPPGLAIYAPLRDTLLLLAWIGAFFGATVQWREQRLAVRDNAA